ncbi:DUF4870 domain-containing protein [uncultured Amnibacterium sp.]|uniref:DUF4870 domain-containing protein n=1 Tax=uncultured Amnibacterium sp. TaxID=1631851 RepID=UPI0035CB4244
MTNDQPPAYQAAQPLSPSDERMWATLVHVGGIVIGFISPLLGYLLLKDRSAFVGENSKNALNFQITILIAYVVGGILTLVLIGGLVLLAAWIVNIIFSIMGALAANKGQVYKYPLTIPIIK